MIELAQSTGIGYGGQEATGHVGGGGGHVTDTGSTLLAFTGLDVALLFGVALLLLCMGVALRRLVT